MEAGTKRLRPILMTSIALIAGTLPTALGLSEASRSRTSMGIAIIGGLISSTLLTLVVIPAAYGYIDDFRQWASRILARIFMPKKHTIQHGHQSPSSGGNHGGTKTNVKSELTHNA
jgi:HAE1 family hydrophobic/amphiphilic exporter-1